MYPGTDSDLVYCVAALRSVVRKTTFGSALTTKGGVGVSAFGRIGETRGL
jgi:hypothetical protein